MNKYAFYLAASQSGGEGKGNTQTDVGTDKQTNLMVQIGIPLGL